jgi:hypothetical protein
MPWKRSSQIRFTQIAVGMSFLVTSWVARADVVELDSIPTGWKIENYIGDVIDLWWTPSPCTNGQMTLPANASADDKKRLWWS